METKAILIRATANESGAVVNGKFVCFNNNLSTLQMISAVDYALTDLLKRLDDYLDNMGIPEDVSPIDSIRDIMDIADEGPDAGLDPVIAKYRKTLPFD